MLLLQGENFPLPTKIRWPTWKHANQLIASSLADKTAMGFGVYIKAVVRQHRLHFPATQGTWTYRPLCYCRNRPSVSQVEEQTKKQKTLPVLFLGLGLETGLIALSRMGHGKKSTQQWGHSSVFENLLFPTSTGIWFPVNRNIPDADIYKVWSSQDINLDSYMYQHTHIHEHVSVFRSVHMQMRVSMLWLCTGGVVPQWCPSRYQ